MKTTLIIGLTSLFALSACATEVQMKAASVSKFDDGSELVMTGALFGRIDGSSRYTLSGGGLECNGTTAKQRDGSALSNMVCTDEDGAQTAYDQTIPAEDYTMSFNGSSVTRFEGQGRSGTAAFGWGRKANPEYLLTLLN